MGIKSHISPTKKRLKKKIVNSIERNIFKSIKWN